jgi:hypothetical protein
VAVTPNQAVTVFVQLAAMDLHFGQAGLLEPYVPEPDSLVHSFDVTFRNPSWLAAAETLFEAWLDAGEVVSARASLERFAAKNRQWSSFLSRGVEDLLFSRLLVAEDTSVQMAVAATGRALKSFRHAKAPWWIAKGIRLLDSLAQAPSHLIGEAADIEQRLELRETGAGTVASGDHCPRCPPPEL